MLELDLVLMPFLESGYDQLDAEDQVRYQQLLSSEDQDMFGWFIHRQEPEDEDLRRIVGLIRAFHAQPR